MSEDRPGGVLNYRAKPNTRLTNSIRSAFCWTIIGLAYGSVLASFSFLSAGFGHGTYVLMGLCSSPISLIQDVFVSLFSIPLLWGLLGTLLGLASYRAGRVVFLILIAAHYSALAIILCVGNFADWSYVPRAPLLVWPGFVIYLVGQIALWAVFGHRVRASRNQRTIY